MKVRPIIVILLLILDCVALFAKAKDTNMPIIAYIGVPERHSTDGSFRTFSDCGFNISLSTYSSLSALITACKEAKKWGVKILGNCPELKNYPDKVAQLLHEEEGFFGYFLQDEPSAPEIKQRQKEIERLKVKDNKHIFYINLFPCYHPDWVKSTMKTENYPDYLRTLSQTSCQQISFDFYPVTANDIRPNWYHNLEMVRKESLVSGKPFWGFVLSTSHDVPFDKGNYYPCPTLAALRLQVYSNLAYGAQAIQYFTYWTPGGGDYHFQEGPIGVDGKKTKTYDIVQQMNRELKAIAPLFYGAKVLSVHHLGGELPEGTTRLTRMPINLSSLKVVSSKGAIISQLEKNGHRYLAIVNKNHEDTINVLIKPLNTTPKHLTKQMQTEYIKSSYSIPPGDVLLFQLK